MLVPVILIGLCLAKNLVIRVMALSSALLINSTTCMICIALFFMFYGFHRLREKSFNGWSFGRITIGVIAIAIMMFILYEPLRERTLSLYSYAID